MATHTLVPWNPGWLNHDTLDLHAVYRRPKRNPDIWALERDKDKAVIRDEYGFVVWDYMHNLPVSNHVRWEAKGFEYVTLSAREDVLAAADPQLKKCSILAEPAQYLHGPSRQPWVRSLYLDDIMAEKTARIARIQANVERGGVELAEEFERQTDPGYRITKYFERDPAPLSPAAPPPKRGRGRPKGSKNQPKTGEVEPSEVAPL